MGGLSFYKRSMKKLVQQKILYFQGLSATLFLRSRTISNLIFWMALHTPLTVVERYRHSHDVFPDANRIQPFGSGATCAYPHRDLMIRNNTEQDFQLCLRVGVTHLDGAWRAMTPPAERYEIVEKSHNMDQASWGGYIRHNELFRRCYDASGTLLREEFLFANDAIMMYSLLLPE